MSNVKFNNQNAVFFNTLRERVSEYFTLNNLKQTGNFKLFFKTIVLLSALFSSYIFLVFFTPGSHILSIAICALMGLIMSTIGFNVLHDGAHGSYSSNKTVNNFMSYTLNLLGGSSFMWKQKHNINHHTYTNIEGMDDDIDVKPLIRINGHQKKYWFHRFQHIYSFILYGFTYLFWVFYNDFKKYFSGKVSESSNLTKMKWSEHVMFWFTKLAYVFVFLVFPIYNVGLLDTLVGYGIAVFVCGLVISIVFQLAHIFENAEFVAPENDSLIIENEWAVHQINTTANFATRNKTVSWLLGGLNFQIEHHLFPRISHIHYPEISKIVQATCKEYSIDYKEFPTVGKAIISHILHLKYVGVN